MRFTVPFLLAIAVYVATVLGANQTSFTPNEDMLYDVVSASDALGFRLERALGLSEQLALMLGALLLTLPALATFHIFRIGFGGSVQSLIHEERLSRQLNAEREKYASARYANAGVAPKIRPQEGEVLTRARAGDTATVAATSAPNTEKRSGSDRRDGKERRRGLGANLAAALKGTTKKATARSKAATASESTILEGSNGTDNVAPSKDRWSGILDKKPDLSRLKSGAQNLREKITPRSGTTKLSLDDIADDVADKSS